MNRNTAVIVSLLVLAVLVIVVISVTPKSNGVACTMEALICPDRTAVGRVGPNCEFTPCPTQTK